MGVGGVIMIRVSGTQEYSGWVGREMGGVLRLDDTFWLPIQCM